MGTRGQLDTLAVKVYKDSRVALALLEVRVCKDLLAPSGTRVVKVLSASQEVRVSLDIQEARVIQD